MDNKDNREIKENAGSGENNKTSRATRHTWIGDEEELRRQEAMTERRTYTLSPQATRIVDKQKKKYSGFITDEELQNSEIIKIEDRKTVLVRKEDISQTRIYDPIADKSMGDRSKEAEDGAEEKVRKGPIEFRLTQGRLKALAAALVIVLLIAIFDISFFVMRSGTGSLPAKTDEMKAITAKLQKYNDELNEEIAVFGDSDQIKEQKESWERLKTKLEEPESEPSE